ncbi:MAG: hydroxysqualene dehydroxylase HpnE [Rhodocyclaceae bacterium]|nr:hydroxysqualene dehydroxylase HpnE [Rhodocyclaceae bacterium]
MVCRVAIVGAGWAGLACAVELADAGCSVDVFEASRTLGGRARAIALEGLTVDNGAHLLIGAYTETLRLIAKVGAGKTAFLRTPLHLEYPGRCRLAAPAWPAPWHLVWALLTAQGLRWREKLAALRFMRALNRCHFRLPRDYPARRLFATQPEALRRFLWEPLCLAALNTPPAEASAQVFLNVLKASLAGKSADSDLLFPACDLSRLFPEPAAAFVAARGGRVLRGRRIRSLAELSHYDQRVIAVAPQHLATLAPELAASFSFTWQPIATCYLQYPAGTRLSFPMLGLSGYPGQWLFDRGALCGQDGLFAAVISGAGAWQSLSHAALAKAIHDEVASLLPKLPPPRWSRVIVEKRATFACTPNLARPATATAVPGLWLAGDYVAGEYPATLEGAVRSGIAAARSILQATGL